MSIPIFKIMLTVVLGYFLGSINSSLVVGKFYGTDIRKHGSGNAGATNTLRTLGKKAALFVTLGDVLKGIAACLVGLFLVGNVSGIGNIGLMTGGLASIVGHNWPVFFGFKGGKGALTSFTVVMMMDWRIGLMLLLIFILVVALTRFVSLGSITAALSFPILSSFPMFGKNSVFIAISVVLGLLVIIRHHANISRIIKGTESKLGMKNKA